jgi:lysophospholipase L1-like esterase
MGAVPVLITQARLVSELNTETDRNKIRYDYQLLSHDALVKAFNECDEAVRQVANEKGALLIDLSKKFSGRSDIFRDHVHTTAKGSQALAEEVAAEMKKILGAKL